MNGSGRTASGIESGSFGVKNVSLENLSCSGRKGTRSETNSSLILRLATILRSRAAGVSGFTRVPACRGDLHTNVNISYERIPPRSDVPCPTYASGSAHECVSCSDTLAQKNSCTSNRITTLLLVLRSHVSSLRPALSVERFRVRDSLLGR